MTNMNFCSNSTFCEDFLNQQNLSDCKVRTEDGYVYNIHRFILAKNSEYFYALFFGINPNRKDILIPGIKGSILGTIIRYLCTGGIVFTDDNLIDVLTASDYLSIEDLFSKAKMYAKDNISIRNCCLIICFSIDMNLQDLYEESCRFIQTHFDDVVNERTSKLESLPVDLLKELICDENLYVRNYTTVWNSIVRWVEFDSVLRQVHLLDLLRCLKTEHVNEDLAFFIVCHYLVIENPYCQHLNKLRKSRVFGTYLPALTRFLRNIQKLNFKQEICQSKLYFIMKKNSNIWKSGINDLYITYDENFDIWRKVTEMPFVPNFFLSIESRVYVISSWDEDLQINFYSFDFIRKQWTQLENARLPSTRVSETMPPFLNPYFLLKHEELIYLLCGVCDLLNAQVCRVEVYTPSVNMWSSVQPMASTISPFAVSLDKKIYVIGYRYDLEQLLDGDEIPEMFEHEMFDGEMADDAAILDLELEHQVLANDNPHANQLFEHEEDLPGEAIPMGNDIIENGDQGIELNEEDTSESDGEEMLEQGENADILGNDFENHVLVHENPQEFVENEMVLENREEPNEDIVEHENIAENSLHIFQEYDQESDTWKLLPTPSDFRFICDFIALHNIIYLIGKTGDGNQYDTIFVEGFDTHLRQWESLPNLPFIYNKPKAVILNNRLIVYDNLPNDISYLHMFSKAFPAIYWNSELKSWEPLSDSSILNYFHQYNFYAIDDEDALKIIKGVNRDNNHHFVKSPFQ